METAESISAARAIVLALPRPVGFVPTMGALHEGHLALVRRARERCAAVVASIFVNPLQFGPREDLASYPREPGQDRLRLEESGVDALFAPDVSAMYGDGFSTAVDVGALATRYEGAHRPGHFAGVATVIAKLLNIFAPDVLVLGQKDAQQAVVVRKMIRELNFSVETEVVETVRERDGLAMSSRNRRLDAAARVQAATLYGALRAVCGALAAGRSKSDSLAAGFAVLSPAARLDYLDVVDAATFEAIEIVEAPALAIGAARFGNIRLIDNVAVGAV